MINPEIARYLRAIADLLDAQAPPAPLVTSSLLMAIYGCSQDLADRYADPLHRAMRRYQINTPARIAAFLAQVGHESDRLRYVVENMNYSAERLQQVFGKYFTVAEAQAYARQPQRIGSRVYGGRMGNGDEASGDGFRYRGRGLIQLTGKDNYKQMSGALGVDFVAHPERLEEPQYAALSAGEFWDSRKLNPLADAEDVREITRRINGGYNGLPDRQALYSVAKRVITGATA